MKVDKKKELPIATEILKDYKETNRKLIEINRRLYYVIAALLIVVVAMSIYIIFCWDSLHPNAGAIRQEIQCDT